MSAAPSNLRMIREAATDSVVVAFWGRMDAEAVRQAAEGLDKAVEGTQPVIVDLSDVDAIDSLGVALLVRLAKNLRDQGRELAVIPGDGRVARVLGLARVDRILNVALTRDAARRSLGL